MLEAILWGLVQGLTEFLPVSSSGHLVLVPAALNVEPPDLATTAVLHLGTLAAVLAYYRKDLVFLLKFRTERLARRTITLLAIGTVPAVILGLLFESMLEELQSSTAAVGIALLYTGAILWVGSRLSTGDKTVETLKPLDALIIGVAQSVALIPGVSRSGMTISTGFMRELDREESARFAFLLAVPVILGGGLLQATELADAGALKPELIVGTLVAAVSGYVAIAWLIKGLARWGMKPFAVYCWIAGLAAIFLL